MTLFLMDFTFAQDDGWQQSGWRRYRHTSEHRWREWFERGEFFRSVNGRAPERVAIHDLWLADGLTEAGQWLHGALPNIRSLRQDYMTHFSDDLDERQYRAALAAVMVKLNELESEAEQALLAPALSLPGGGWTQEVKQCLDTLSGATENKGQKQGR